MRKLIPAFLTLLVGAPLGFAQPGAQRPDPNLLAAQQPNPYAQAAGLPDPYVQQGVAQPVRQVQYPYGGNGYAPPPAYAYPPRYGYAPSYGYNNGYGVNYYYVQNPPYGNNAPYRPTAASPPPPPPGVTWPQTAQPNPPIPAQAELDPVPLEGEMPAQVRAPGIAFHRTPAEHVWFSTGYPATFIRPMRMNSALVTTGSAGDIRPGALGQSGTAVLFGDKSVDFGLFSGFRAEVGVFLDCENRFSLEVGGLYLLANTQSFLAVGSPNGTPVIARPFFNISDGFDRQAVFANTGPVGSATGSYSGSIAIDVKSQLTGGEINARFHQYVQDRYHFDFLGGFRYQRLEESLRIQEQVTPIAGNAIPFLGATFAAPNFLMDQDNFRCLNQFFGPQVGARLSWEERWFNLDGFFKLAAGATLERTQIFGSTTLVTPNSTQQANGGILALPSNSGTFSRAVFGVLPEFGFDLGVNVTQNVRVKFGYSLLLWNHVVRPGGAYDVNLNPAQIPGSPFFGTATGPTGPLYRFNDEFFWSHSFNLGLEVHF
jgi:Putative beta barrel porin-7 (BBP7)